MDLKGLKINFIGDSITEGYGTSGEKCRFSDVLEDKYGVISRNYGICGTRFAIQTSPSHDPMYDKDFVSRVDEMDLDCDVVIVFGGTNDYGHGDAPLGDVSDRTQFTFCGAMHALCEKLINRYPGSKIIFSAYSDQVLVSNSPVQATKQCISRSASSITYIPNLSQRR